MNQERREFTNQFPPYDGRRMLVHGKLEPSLAQRIAAQVERLLSTLENEIHDSADHKDYYVYVGWSGIALMYLHLYRVFGNEKYLAMAKEIIKRPLKHVKGGRHITFLEGDAGPLAIAAHIYHLLGDQVQRDACVKTLVSFYPNVLRDPSLPNELLYGRVGYLYSLLYIRKNCGVDVDPSVIEGVVEGVLESGQALSRRDKSLSPLMFEWHETKYVGAAHGITGILFLIMEACDLYPSVRGCLDSLIRPTVDFCLTLRFPSGNIASSVGKDRDLLVHWCHGATGAGMMFLKAYQVFGDPRYLEAAKTCAHVVWNRGILIKGYGLCHGTAGNAYIFLKMFQLQPETNEEFLYQAACFAEWCLNYGKHGCRIADRPYSLFEGMAGTIYFLADMLNPEKACFPAFEI